MNPWYRLPRVRPVSLRRRLVRLDGAALLVRQIFQPPAGGVERLA
jgi:hypothetical protein